MSYLHILHPLHVYLFFLIHYLFIKGLFSLYALVCHFKLILILYYIILLLIFVNTYPNDFTALNLWDKHFEINQY